MKVHDEPVNPAPVAQAPESGLPAQSPPREGRRFIGHSVRSSTAVLLVIAILATAGTRYWIQDYRHNVLNRGQQVIADSSQSLSNMSSYALALLLGGLRGPLVMMLWISSESQKSNKDLEDFDTKVEWIRMLQPEFDSVHMFEIWNKAYNISVQMASLSNKYSTILDALDYADKVNAQRPNDINIMMAIADVYFNKLGNSAEKDYYRKRVRKETQWRVVPPQAKASEAFHPTRLPPVLDAKGDLLPAYQKLYKYLIPYQPFPYGLSPFAIAYNYYRISQYLQNVDHEQHLQISPSVIDSRPALTLKTWATEEWATGRKLELQLFNKPVPNDQTDENARLDMELPTASTPVTARMNPSVDIKHLLYSYALAARLAGDAVVAYRQHLKNPNFNVANLFTYQSHVDHCIGMVQICTADENYIKAMLAHGSERKHLLVEARKEYQQAIRDFRIVMFKWYTADNVLEKLDAKKSNIQNLSNEKLGAMSDELHHMMATHAAGADMNQEDRDEYEHYIARSQARLTQINAALEGN